MLITPTLGRACTGTTVFPGTREQAYGCGANHLALADDDIARLGLLARFAHIRLAYRSEYAYVLAHSTVTGEGRVLNLDHRIGTLRHNATRHDANCLSGLENDLAHNACTDPVHNLKIDRGFFARILERRRDYGKSVHCRIIERRNVDIACEISGGDSPNSGKQIDLFDRHSKTSVTRELNRPLARLINAYHILAHLIILSKGESLCLFDRVPNLPEGWTNNPELGRSRAGCRFNGAKGRGLSAPLPECTVHGR